jgi:D-alanyl-D-alanine endopeptidase (penicillin-binding protein 7)
MTNVTTAHDLAKMVAAAGTYPFISAVSSKPEIKETIQVKKKSKTVTLPNTNQKILFDFSNILVSKTGFTSRAGRCLAMLVERQGLKYAIIILGEPSNKARETVARNLLALTL